MKKLVILLILLMVIFPIVNVDSKSNKVSYQVMEELKISDIVRIYVEHSGEILVPGKRLNEDGRFSIEVTEDELIKLEKNYLVQSIEKVQLYHPLLDLSVPLINTTPVWNTKFGDLNLTGLYQTACILDTGADFTHPDLLGKNLTCVIDCTGVACVENCSLGDSNTHGTHVAGIIGANGNLKGVAPDAGLIMVQVCVGDSCSTDDIEQGLEWCVQNATQYNITAISMSIGNNATTDGYSTYCNSNFLTNDVNDAVSKNISVLIASGNDGNTVNISAPSCIENATAVGWTTGAGMMATNSNRNSLIALVAPGSLINSTIPGGYVNKQGTSMATPHVAGAFLLINQMRQLEGNSRLTVQEVQDSFNLTYDLIDDTINSGLNYSRIDIYSAALYLDSKAPDLNLTSPANGTVSQLTQQTLYCNASDELQLDNLTMFVWNSTGGLINSSNLTATNNSLNLNLSLNMSDGTYHWACESYDNKKNYFITSNNTLRIKELYSILTFPENETHTQINETTFNCSINSLKEISNLTFHLWNSTGLIYNESVNLSGTTNNSEFNYTLAIEESYLWNCEVVNNDSESSFGDSNFTITYDITSPVINLTSPSNDASFEEGSRIFAFNLTETNPANCSLIIDDSFVQTNSSIVSVESVISYSPGVGTFSWKINCQDYSGFSVNSSARDIEFTEAGGSSSSGGNDDNDDSTTPAEAEVDSISELELIEGITKVSNLGEAIEFEFDYITHEIILERIFDKSAEIVIQSDPIRFVLKVSEWKNINLNGDSYYDLYIELISVGEGDAQIKIKKIHEEIPVYGLLGGNESNNSNQGDSQETITIDDEKLKTFLTYVAISLLVGFLIYFAIALEKHEKNKSNLE